jgi:general secretion pathway protein M
MATAQPPTGSGLTAWRQRWATLSDRERALALLAAAAVALLLLWWIALQPAWRTLTQTPAQTRAVQLQALQMQRLANETRDLRALPPVDPAQSAQALKTATERLGSHGKLTLLGDRATLTLDEATPESLHDWLSEVRSAARVRPVNAQLDRTDKGLKGQIVVALPSPP